MPYLELQQPPVQQQAAQQQQQQQQTSLRHHSQEQQMQVAPRPLAGGSLSPASPAAAAAPPQHREPLQGAVAQLASDPHSGAAAEVLARLLRNVLGSPGEAKFRRVRLSNPRIQEAVVDARGGLETLLATGFEIVFEEAAAEEDGSCGGEGPGRAAAEGYAELAPGAPLEPLQRALALLAPLLPAPAPAELGAAASEPSSASGRVAAAEASPQREPLAASSGGASSAAAAAAAAAPQQTPRQQQWDPPRERNTQVLLPAAPSDVPDWFFQRTGAELRAQFLAAIRRREQDQTLMTRAMRDRLHSPPTRLAPTHATVRVRFPEGVSLQGEFNPREPLAALHAWVADALADPLSTFELVAPHRRPPAPLDPCARGATVAGADLLPSATLNLRWTGASAAAMREQPALRAELLQAARA